MADSELQLVERRKLVAELVKLGVETQSTAYLTATEVRMGQEIERLLRRTRYPGGRKARSAERRLRSWRQIP